MSGYSKSQLDASDPDTDVPDELKFILAAHSDRGSIMEEDQDTSMAAVAAEPASADDPDTVTHTHELPVFRLTLADDDDQTSFGIDGESAHGSEDDTKKSFDFTGEIKRLNESGASDRASFVEQLEMAFKTPAKIDLQYDFGNNLRVEVPPLPSLPDSGSIATTSADVSTLGLPIFTSGFASQPGK
jgi:serine/arginine repetitive matrix protein 2